MPSLHFCPCVSKALELMRVQAFSSELAVEAFNKTVVSWFMLEPPYHFVWTNMIGADFRPRHNSSPGFDFVCDLRLVVLPNSLTRYHARVMHKDGIGKAQH